MSGKLQFVVASRKKLANVNDKLKFIGNVEAPEIVTLLLHVLSVLSHNAPQLELVSFGSGPEYFQRTCVSLI